MLEQELAYYDREKSRLISLYEGQFALIKADDLVGTFTTFEEAFNAGVQRFGTDAFLIKQVAVEEPVAQFPALSVGMLNAHS